MTAPPPRTDRSADLAQKVGAWMQVGFLVALFVLWRVYHLSLFDAAERCIVAGAAVYTALGLYAAIVRARGGERPALAIASQLTRFSAICVYGYLRYVQHRGLWHALAIWVVLYIASLIVASRARRRGGQQAAGKVSPFQP